MRYAQSSSAVGESNPYRIEVILMGLTWGSRLRDNPRLREVSPTGKTHSALLNQTWCGVRLDCSVERVFNLFHECETAFRSISTRSSVWNASGQKMNSWGGRLADSALLNQRNSGRRGGGIWVSGPSGDRLKTRRTDDGGSSSRRGVGFQPAGRVIRRGWLGGAWLGCGAWGTDKPGGSSPRD